MRIELSATPNWLKITWSFYDTAIETEILRRLGTVPRALGNGRRWFAPVSELWRLTTLFDKASYQYEAMCAADAFDKPQRTVASPVASTPLTEDEKLGPLFQGVREEENRVKYPKWRRKGRKVEL